MSVYTESWNKEAEGCLVCLTSAGNVRIGWHKSFAALYIPVNDPQSTTKFDFGITNKFQHEGKFTNMESAIVRVNYVFNPPPR